MRRFYAALAAYLCLISGRATADPCPQDTISIVDRWNGTGHNGIVTGPYPSGSLTLAFPRQEASYDLFRRQFRAISELYAPYDGPAHAAHAWVSAHDQLTLIGPPTAAPLTFTAQLRITARCAGHEYDEFCPSPTPCEIPSGRVDASITEGTSNSATWWRMADGTETTAVSVHITRLPGQTFSLAVDCKANADYAANPWLDQSSNRTAELSAQLTFPDLPAGYDVVSCEGSLLWTTGPACTETGNQRNPVAAPDGAGGAIVAWWEDYRGVCAQRFDPTGRPLWAAGGVVVSPTFAFMILVQIAGDGDGGAVVSWFTIGGDPEKAVRAQRINAAGELLWTPGGVLLSGAAEMPPNPSLIPDGSGGAITCWIDSHVLETGGPPEIHTSRVSGSGVLLWSSKVRTLETMPNSEMFPSFATDGAGGEIVVWRDVVGADPPRIYAQRVDSAGSVRWAAEGVVACTNPAAESQPIIAADLAGGAFIGWMDARGGVYCQRASRDGSTLWPSDGTRLFDAPFGQLSMIADGSGGAIVIDDHDRAQRVSAAGTRLWGTGVPCGTGEGGHLAIASDAASGAFIVAGHASFANGIVVQHLREDGTAAWPSPGYGVPLFVGHGDAPVPAVCSDGTGGAFAIWEDSRDGTTYDLFALRIRMAPPDRAAPLVRVLSPNGGEVLCLGQTFDVRWTATDDQGVGSVDVLLSRRSTAGPWELLADGLPNTGSFLWAVSGPLADGSALVRVVARDVAGNTGGDSSDAPFTIGSAPVPTLVEQFRLEDRADGVAIVWSLSDANASASITPQHGMARDGEWTEVAGAPLVEGRRFSLVDHDARSGVTHWYRLAGRLGDGRTVYETPRSIVHSGVTEFALERPTPNPVGRTTSVTYALPRPMHVRLSLMDVQGREVAVLADADREAGSHFNSLDVSGLRAGLYFLSLRADRKEARQRLVVIR